MIGCIEDNYRPVCAIRCPVKKGQVRRLAISGAECHAGADLWLDASGGASWWQNTEMLGEALVWWHVSAKVALSVLVPTVEGGARYPYLK